MVIVLQYVIRSNVFNECIFLTREGTQSIYSEHFRLLEDVLWGLSLTLLRPSVPLFNTPTHTSVTHTAFLLWGLWHGMLLTLNTHLNASGHTTTHTLVAPHSLPKGISIPLALDLTLYSIGDIYNRNEAKATLMSTATDSMWICTFPTKAFQLIRNRCWFESSAQLFAAYYDRQNNCQAESLGLSQTFSSECNIEWTYWI